MRFFIISKRMFKKSDEDAGSKRKFYKKKSFAVIVSVAIVLAAVAGWALYRVNRVPAVSYCEGVGKFSLEAYSKEDREDFFEQFSYSAREVAVEDIIIPCDSLQFEEYNELQKSQGLDLMPYCGKQAQMYTLKLLNDPEEETQNYGVLIVYRGRVVAAHITDFIYPACVKALTE